MVVVVVVVVVVIHAAATYARQTASAAELEAVAQACGDARAVVTDVTVRGDAERLRDCAIERFGGVDLWVNNAGVGIVRPALELTDDDVDRMFLVNTKSVLWGMQALVSATDFGRIAGATSGIGPAAPPRGIRVPAAVAGRPGRDAQLTDAIVDVDSRSGRLAAIGMALYVRSGTPADGGPVRFPWFFLAFSCAPKAPGATTPAASEDVAGVSSRVAAELPGWEGFARYKSPPRIVVLPTENHTKFDVDTQLATTKLVNGLIRVSGEHFDVVDPEAWSARGDQAGAPGLLMLQSAVQAMPSDAGNGRPAVQVLVTYRLVESDTARAVWASDFEWTKVKGPDGYENMSP